MQDSEHPGSEKDMGKKTTGCTSMQKSICRSTAECTVGISWTLGQELSN